MHTRKRDDHYPIYSKLHHEVSAFTVWPYYACSYTVLVHTYYYTIVWPMVITIIIIVKLTGLQSIILFLLRMSVKKRKTKFEFVYCDILHHIVFCQTTLLVAHYFV